MNKSLKNTNNSSNTNKKTALETAYAYLAGRMRTVNEVEKKLADKGYSAAEISEALSELKEMRYLDDYQFALRYYEYNREKKRGAMRAERELIEKGVDRETARNAKEDFLYENKVDEYEDALAIAMREVSVSGGADSCGTEHDECSSPGTGREFDDKLAAKIARKLESKGFTRNDIFRVLDALRRRTE